MLDRLQQRLTYANVMATIAVFGVLAGGGAYAASKLGASDIAKNAVRSKHIKQSAVKSKHVKDGQLRVADLADEAKGARAFALAGRNNGFGSGLPHPGFASATRDSEGVYCLTPESGGVDPDRDPPAITAEYFSSNDTDLFAYWGASGSSCDEGDYEVQTYALGAGSPVLSDEVRFVIVVP